MVDPQIPRSDRAPSLHRPTGWTPARGIKLILALQLAIAAVLFGADIARVLPDLGSAPAAPRMNVPILPGDQIRDFDLRHVPEMPNLPNAGDMPSRLLFEQTEDGVSLTGAIAAGDADRFADWIAARGLPDRVSLHSTGGSVRDALAIGRMLRAEQTGVAVAEGHVCLSACPYILAGGSRRDVHTDAFVGVHQHSFGTNTVLPAFLAVEDIQRGQGEVMAYLIEMDVDPALMQHALVTPSRAIYLLTANELKAYRLATDLLGAAAVD